MATTDITVDNLVINTLTKAQYQTITPSATELYFVTDDTSEIFIAEYGVTTYQEVLDAYNAGETIVCQYKREVTASLKIIYNLYLINFATNTTFNFSGTISGTAQYFYTNLTSSGWESVGSKTCETTSNKVTSLSSSSTNTQYPSAKCVYDALQNAGVNISYDATTQTLTIG
jgi:hypothetical protein